MHGGEGPVRVLLVEDHEMVAASLTAALSAESDLEVVGWASTVADGVRKYDELRPDVVLMDYRLPDGEGTVASAQIRALHADACILLVTGSHGEDIVASALEAGCSGFVGKDRGLAELVQAIRAAARGAAVFPAELLAAATARVTERRRGLGDDLTNREREVLARLAEGRSTEEIGDELFLSHHTVRNHVRNVLAKLRAHTKLEAVVIAAREGLVDLRPR